MYNDLLGREEIIDNIIKIIDANSASISFDVNGAWGIGKSFLLDLLKERLVELNNPFPKYLVLSYNCWKYDYYEEPLIAIVSSIISNLEDPSSNILKSFRSTTKKKIISVFKNAASSFIKNKIGVDLVEVYEGYKEDYQKSQEAKYEFDFFQEFTKAILSVRQQIVTLTKKYKLILMIDELDRCLPTYALKVMERIHHLFEESSNITVIYSLDRLQLENTIRNIFGENTNSAEFLKKFIDFTIPLDTGETMDYRHYFPISLHATIKKYFKYTLNNNEHIVATKFFSSIFSSIEIRKTKKIIQKIEVILNLILEEENLDYSLMGAILIYMFFKNEYDELLKYLFSPITSKGNHYDDIKKFLDIRSENYANYKYKTSTSYNKFDHNIAWILYDSNLKLSDRKDFILQRVTPTPSEDLKIEINLFRKFIEFSNIID